MINQKLDYKLYLYLNFVGDVNAEKRNKTRTLNIEDENTGDEGGEDKNEEAEEACHVKQANENDIQVNFNCFIYTSGLRDK